MFLVLVEECSGKHDDGAAEPVAQNAIALNTLTGLGHFRAA